jgi:hypothetical protein
MMVQMLLADAAQAVGGKLYILGAGWSQIGPEPEPMAVVMHIQVPWDEANQQHELRLELVDADGDPVMVETPLGEQPLVLGSQFEVGRPPGTTPGTPLDLGLVIKVGPLPLRPGGRFQWRLSIDGESEEDWHKGFGIRQGPAPPEGD